VGKAHVDNGTEGHNGRIRVPGALAFGAVLLLALGAAASSSAHGSAARGAGPLAAQWWLFGLAALCAGGAAVSRLRRRMFGMEAASSAEHRLQRGVLALAAVATAAVPLALFLVHNHDGGTGAGVCGDCPMLKITETRPVDTNPAATPNPSPGSGHRALPFETVLLVLACLIALVLAVGLTLLVLRWLRGRGVPQEIGGAPLPASEDEQDGSALNQAVLAGREALEGEARAAIIACYAAMEDSLTAAGVPRLESDSPADLLARAADHGTLDGPAPGQLAGLFREARYSTHPMNADHLGRARAALDEIAAQLAAHEQARDADEARQAVQARETEAHPA
jgi:Domain of unknown function (DUF4129)